MTTKTSKKLRKTFEKEIEKATTIDEIVWIDVDFKQNMDLACDDLLYLCRISRAKKDAFKAEGQVYQRAKRPAWRYKK